MTSDQFSIHWIDRRRPPRAVPNPAFPDGVDIDMRKSEHEPACRVTLPYPTGRKNVGTWLVNCKGCGCTAIISAASRPDDPRSVLISCRRNRLDA